jgi:hypothetical protein
MFDPLKNRVVKKQKRQAIKLVSLGTLRVGFIELFG